MKGKPFWSRVDLSGGLDACWIWQGALREGYGQVKVQGQTVRTHRHAYELAHGPIPAGLLVMHSCDNRRCCNPAHLSVGTRRDNINDAMRKRRLGRRLTWPTVEAIRDGFRAGTRAAQLARDFGVTPGMVSMIVRGKSWPERVA